MNNEVGRLRKVEDGASSLVERMATKVHQVKQIGEASLSQNMEGNQEVIEDDEDEEAASNPREGVSEIQYLGNLISIFFINL